MSVDLSDTHHSGSLDLVGAEDVDPCQGDADLDEAGGLTVIDPSLRRSRRDMQSVPTLTIGAKVITAGRGTRLITRAMSGAPVLAHRLIEHGIAILDIHAVIRTPRSRIGQVNTGVINQHTTLDLTLAGMQVDRHM